MKTQPKEMLQSGDKDGDTFPINRGGLRVAEAYSEKMQERIVRAVNGFEALEAENRRLRNSHDELVDALRAAELQLDRDWGIGKSPISKKVRDALARAEGKE